jgi:hypothetical protein
VSGPVARARGLLARGGWIDVAGADGRYPLRTGPDRRGRTTLNLDEASLRALIAAPGLKARPGGGWTARAEPLVSAVSPGGAPGRVEGLKAVMEPDGRLTLRRANMGQSPIAWLAQRRDAAGRPLLNAVEVAAGERLRRDAEIAQTGPSMTMRWDALPRSGGSGSSARAEPGDRALAAGRRVAEALAACDPGTRAFVAQVCIRETSLQHAEREAGLRRREGKAALKAGLQALARHYGLG